MSKTRTPQTRNRVRMSFTLPPSYRADLSYISHRMKISQSALVSDLLAKSLPLMANLLREIPPDEVPNELSQARVIRRYKNDSQQIIRDELELLNAQIALLTTQLDGSSDPHASAGESL